MALIETIILIPTHDNDGQRFGRELFHEFERHLAGSLGGFTVGRAVEGGWMHADALFLDRTVEYLVGLEGWQQLPTWLAAVEWARVAFRQESIFVRVSGAAEALGPPPL